MIMETEMENSGPQGEAQTVLAIDIGGSHVKIRSSAGGEERKVESGKTMSGPDMVAAVKAMAADMTYDVIAMGYPGPSSTTGCCATPSISAKAGSASIMPAPSAARCASSMMR